MRLSTLLMVFIICATAAHAQTKATAERPIADNFVRSELNWSSDPRPGFVLRWKTFPIDGEIHICGAVTFPSAQTRQISRNILRRSYITYEDKKSCAISGSLRATNVNAIWSMVLWRIAQTRVLRPPVVATPSL